MPLKGHSCGQGTRTSPVRFIHRTPSRTCKKESVTASSFTAPVYTAGVLLRSTFGYHTHIPPSSRLRASQTSRNSVTVATVHISCLFVTVNSFWHVWNPFKSYLWVLIEVSVTVESWRLPVTVPWQTFRDLILKFDDPTLHMLYSFVTVYTHTHTLVYLRVQIFTYICTYIHICTVTIILYHSIYRYVTVCVSV